MRLEHYSQQKLRDEIIAIVGRYLDLHQFNVFFFGSRVDGTSTERSDIDVGIEGRNPVPRHIMQRIRDDIGDLPTMYTIEVVDFRRVSDEFRGIALQRIEPLTVSTHDQA